MFFPASLLNCSPMFFGALRPGAIFAGIASISYNTALSENSLSLASRDFFTAVFCSL
jgi:hypothetical protein